MPATISVMPDAQRKSKIEQIPDSGPGLRIPFKGAHPVLKTKRVPDQVLIYRLNNARTIVSQKDYILSNSDVSATFFSNGEENLGPQQVQHGFLTELARENRANIYAALDTQATQTEPLLITEHGVVVNGNRRLAAMRVLRAGNPQEFSSFSHVEVAVLPSGADENDLMAIEIELQIAPDLRLEYGWVEEALILRRQLDDHNWKLVDAIALWKQTKDELNDRLSRLLLAEKYLEYSQSSENYKLVSEDTEEAFRTVHRSLKSQSSANASTIDAQTFVFFAVLQNRLSLHRRVYDYARRISEVTDRIMPLVEAEVPVSETTSPVPNVDDPLAELPAQEDEINPGHLQYLGDSKNSKKIAEWADAGYEAYIDDVETIKQGQQFLKAAQSINSTAASLNVTGADPDTIGKGLAQLIMSVDQVSRKLEQAVSSHPEATKSVDLDRLTSARNRLSGVIKSCSN